MKPRVEHDQLAIVDPAEQRRRVLRADWREPDACALDAFPTLQTFHAAAFRCAASRLRSARRSFAISQNVLIIVGRLVTFDSPLSRGRTCVGPVRTRQPHIRQYIRT